MKKRSKKKIIRNISLTVVIILLIPIMHLVSNAAEAVTYSANEWDTFKNRTKEEIAAEYSKAISTGETYRNGTSSSYYKETPSTASPYSYGKLTEDTHLAMSAMTNYYRWLVGVQPLTATSQHSDDLQAGALIRKWDFAHVVDNTKKPDDMEDELWNQGASASHNILALGYTPRGAITGWLNEGYDTSENKFDTIGHRMGIIGKSISTLQFGYVGNIAIGKYTGGNTSDLAYTSFPAAGYMPYNDISPSSSTWSIELNSSIIKYNSLSDLIVRVTNENTNESYDCTVSNGKLTSSYGALSFFQPTIDGGKYQEGDKYKVEVFGLIDVSSGDDAKISYTTELFDVTQYADTFAKSVVVSGGWSNIVLTNSNMTTEKLNKITAILPNTAIIKTESGRDATVPLQGKWILDEANKCWTNTVDTSQIPTYIQDKDGVIGEIKITYNTNSRDYTGEISISPTNPTEGIAGTFTMTRYMLSTNTYELYQVNSDGTGEYTASKRFNQDSENYSIQDEIISFDINAFKTSDTGTYIGIYYSNNSSQTDVYVAGITDLTVKEKEITSIAVTPPTKTTYLKGEELDVAGGSITVEYTDNTRTEIPLTNEMISNFNSTNEGIITTTVTYNNKTATFDNLIISPPTQLTAIYENTLNDIELPTNTYGSYSWQDDKTTSVGEVGKNTFKITFTPKDSEFKEVTNISITLVVSQAIPEYNHNITLNATYGDTLENLTLPTSNIGTYEFIQNLETSVGNAGTNKEIKVKFVPNDTTNYQTVNDIPITIIVAKAPAPEIEIPTLADITYSENTTLANITLPEGWVWDNQTIIPTVGNSGYKATYTPTDIQNYDYSDKDLNPTISLKVHPAIRHTKLQS